MAKHGKKYREAAAKVDRETLYSPLQAAGLAKETSPTSYDATVEVAMRLGVDPRKADQMVRGTVNLPHGTGKTARVIVFATGDKATEAEAAGADVVGSDDLIARIQEGFLDFDAAIATPDQMATAGRIARTRGPPGGLLGGPRRPRPGGLPGLRRGDRDPRPDGQGRPHRAHPGPPRPDAEPEDGHRHRRRHQRRPRPQRRERQHRG